MVRAGRYDAVRGRRDQLAQFGDARASLCSDEFEFSLLVEPYASREADPAARMRHHTASVAGQVTHRGSETVWAPAWSSLLRHRR